MLSPTDVAREVPVRFPSTDHLVGLCGKLAESMGNGTVEVRLGGMNAGVPVAELLPGLVELGNEPRNWIELRVSGQYSYEYVVQLSTDGTTISNGGASGDAIAHMGLIALVDAQTVPLKLKGRADERVVVPSIDGNEYSRRQHESEVEIRAAKKGAIWGGAIGFVTALGTSYIAYLLG